MASSSFDLLSGQSAAASAREWRSQAAGRPSSWKDIKDLQMLYKQAKQINGWFTVKPRRRSLKNRGADRASTRRRSTRSAQPAGGVHGQYSDLMRFFEYSGYPPQSNYLFLGYYVDMGKQSLETTCLLLAYKVKEMGICYSRFLHITDGGESGVAEEDGIVTNECWRCRVG